MVLAKQSKEMSYAAVVVGSAFVPSLPLNPNPNGSLPSPNNTSVIDKNFDIYFLLSLSLSLCLCVVCDVELLLINIL